MPSDSGVTSSSSTSLHVAGQHAALDRGADGHDFVRVDALVRLLAVEHLLDELLHLRHARRTAHQHHFVDVLRASSCASFIACCTGPRQRSIR